MCIAKAKTLPRTEHELEYGDLYLLGNTSEEVCNEAVLQELEIMRAENNLKTKKSFLLILLTLHQTQLE